LFCLFGSGFTGVIPVGGSACFSPDGDFTIRFVPTHGVVPPGAVVAGKELGGFACGSGDFRDFATASLFVGVHIAESGENGVSPLVAGGVTVFGWFCWSA